MDNELCPYCDEPLHCESPHYVAGAHGILNGMHEACYAKFRQEWDEHELEVLVDQMELGDN